MNILLVDISGRVDIYDDALYEALHKHVGENIKLLRPRHGLLSFIPQKHAASTNIAKRILKMIEGCINDLLFMLLVLVKRPAVLHMQWLPFLDFCSMELIPLWILKFFCKKTKIVLTIHNVYPHNMSESEKASYRQRFIRVGAYIDKYIVHTAITKGDVIREFGIADGKVNICHHGVFVPDIDLSARNQKENGKYKILQFGAQSYYKGTDILVDAVSKLPSTYRDKVQVTIAGRISNDFLEDLKKRDIDGNIIWKPYMLTDEELYQDINNSDMIVLPYRAISQSGVLLLSIFFGKSIICSNLPSFVETMRGDEGDAIDNDLFFENENPLSLSSLLSRYIDGSVNIKVVSERIEHLKDLYSWDNSAKDTLVVYQSLMQ